LLTGKKWMTFVADFDQKVVDCGTSSKFVATGTGNLTFGKILRMDSLFHGVIITELIINF